MKLKFLSKIATLLLLTVLFTNCSSNVDDIPVDLEVNNFVWKGLNAYYLWQSEKPDLADTRFGNQSQLNNYLAGFTTPESLFENLLNKPADRFSWIVDDYIALENAFQGITLNNGMEFGLVQYQNGSNNIYGYVRYVIPNSDADLKGIERGMIFNTIDGTPLLISNYTNLLFGNNTDYTLELADFNNGNPIANGTTYSLTKNQLQENPVAVSKVITVGTLKIGYLMYNQFSSSFDSELNTAFANFKAEAVNDLIIDLRYNGGGSVQTATYLGSMVTGSFTGEIYSKQVWNEKVLEANNPDDFINNFTDKIENETINSLGLPRVYFIVTGSSASASELVINSLSSYIDVKLVGTTTVGKQVGSITLYDSDNYTRNGTNLNPNHTYAMQPIVLEISNKDNENHPEGFTPGITLPGIELAENHGNLGVLGERSDPLLDRALTYITTGARGIFARENLEFTEIYNSKLATPTSNTMYVEKK